ncbi:MAG: L,D-transpeptidase family protein [Gammaproteobacteria bacterium]|nr:L,D-transpeptidase family protein [Gammaproteobacteria bacterium]
MLKNLTVFARALHPRFVGLVLASFIIAPLGQASELRGMISERILQGMQTTASDQETESLALVQSTYVEHLFEPIWVAEFGPKDKALALANALRALKDDGLDPADYGVDQIDALLGQDSLEARADLEVALSLALVQAGSDLASGRLEPRQVYPSAYVYPLDVDKRELLNSARTAPNMPDFLSRLQPAQDNYHRLRLALAKYRKLAETGWPEIPAGPPLKLGVQDQRVGMLRERLSLWGDLPATVHTEQPDLFDAPLVEAVKRFQYRHGLKQDGAIGKASLAALNVSARVRVQQILLNMERRRWMKDRFEPRYVFVNLADFFLKVVDTVDDREKTVFTTHVVVGKPYHQTPEFSHAITYLVINPYWNVPISIARREILPKLRKDPDYLSRKNFALLSGWGKNAYEIDPYAVDWVNMTAREFRFRLRQGPGAGNALGRIKFMFPNKHNVYLHDTPSRSLFKRTRRTFSHGCIRVQNPDQLAAVLLRWQGGWPSEKIGRTIENGKRTVVSLSNPVPVHLAYITAWANKDHTVHFRDDVYGRDAMLARALLGHELGEVVRKYARGVPLANLDNPQERPVSALH